MGRTLGPSNDCEGRFLRFPNVKELIADRFNATDRLHPIVKDARGSLQRMVLYASLRWPFDQRCPVDKYIRQFFRRAFKATGPAQ